MAGLPLMVDDGLLLVRASVQSGVKNPPHPHHPKDFIQNLTIREVKEEEEEEGKQEEGFSQSGMLEMTISVAGAL